MPIRTWRRYPESDAVVASALARGVPIVTSRQMLQWLDARNSSSFGSIAWDGQTLSFSIAADAGANGLQALVPMYTVAGVVNGVTRDGAAVSYGLASRKGVEYATFDAAGGNYLITYGADQTAPTVTSVFPAEGAVNVSPGTAVSAVFSEPMDASTITAATFRLSGPGTTPVAASVAYDAETRTATLTPTASLDAETTYTATIVAGGPADLAGNPIAGDVNWTFTTAAAAACPCGGWSWDGSDLPAVPSAADPNAVELGVKFRSDVDGFITGIRFYKGALNTGTHIGNLWTSDGTRLATATFVGETATGWQQVDFAAPVPITANSVYVASYHAPNGGYAVDAAYFAGTGLDAPPLHFLADGVSGGNGVYLYGPGGFPNQTYNASNYWVDVVFSDTPPTPADDTVPPEVTATTPSNSATGVPASTPVTATFSEAMVSATITGSVFQLLDASDTRGSGGGDLRCGDAPCDAHAVIAAGSLDGLHRRSDGRIGGADGPGRQSVGRQSELVVHDGGGFRVSLHHLASDGRPDGCRGSGHGLGRARGEVPADVDGFITGIRFYKSNTNTGTHVGNLWTSDRNPARHGDLYQ